MFEFVLYIAGLGLLVKYYGIAGAAVAWGLRVLLDFLLLFGGTRRLLPELFAVIKNNGSGRAALLLGVWGTILVPVSYSGAGLLVRLGVLIVTLPVFLLLSWNRDCKCAPIGVGKMSMVSVRIFRRSI